MSRPDSEGKCRCQHCDGKQSARGCLCDAVGVTATIDGAWCQMGNKKSGNLLVIQPAFFRLRVCTQQAAGDLASTASQCLFFFLPRGEKQSTDNFFNYAN